MKRLILFLILFLINSLFCYIVLPLEILPKENYFSKYELNSPKDIISKELISSFFTELEIGTPSQKIPILIKQKIDDYVITSSHQLKNPSRDYISNKLIYDFSQNFLRKYKYFNENGSDTFSNFYCEKRKPYDENEKPIAEEICPSNETILLYDNINMGTKKVENNIYFELAKNSKDNITGVIGLEIVDPYNYISFLSILKKRKLINNYFWFFEFDSWDSSKGNLIIGALPHEIYSNKYDPNDLLFTPSADNKNVYYNIYFDEIFIKDQNGDNNFESQNEKVEMNIESNLIIGSYSYKKYLVSILTELFNDNKCFNDTFKGYDERIDFNFNFEFFYCKNENNIKNKLKELISTIYFYSKDLNFTFELNNNQVLKENGDYIFIYIVFSEYTSRWSLGKQIVLKYNIIFNPDIKNIYFYPKFKVSESKNNNKYQIFKIIGIVVLCIIFCIIGIIFGKFLYGIKKKRRANELKDDNYEYYSEENKEKNINQND